MKADHDATENVRELLAELAEADAETVRPLLLSLQSMAHGEVPPLSAELAAVLKENGSAQTAAPRRLRHRSVVFWLALMGALVAGAGTAAAVSPQFRSDAAQAIAGVINAIPFGHPAVVHPSPSAPPTVVHTPGPPARGESTSHATPSSGSSTHSNRDGGSSSGRANPKSTSHPTPPADPPAKGHGGGAP
jgi:hypothetical protein